MEEVYLLLGSNIGDRVANIRLATKIIGWHVGDIQAESAMYETSPWGIIEQPGFINQAIKISTCHNPFTLMNKLQQIEKYISKKFVKKEKYGPRVIDIDILFYGAQIISNVALEVPHPRLYERNFALKPLAEIAPDLIHPINNLTINQLKSHCTDKGVVTLLPEI